MAQVFVLLMGVLQEGFVTTQERVTIGLTLKANAPALHVPPSSFPHRRANNSPTVHHHGGSVGEAVGYRKES